MMYIIILILTYGVYITGNVENKIWVCTPRYMDRQLNDSYFIKP